MLEIVKAFLDDVEWPYVPVDGETAVMVGYEGEHGAFQCFAGVREELVATAGVRLNEDLAPICYYYGLALWLSRFYPNLRGVFESAGLVSLWWVAIPLALAVLLVRWRRGLRRPTVHGRPQPGGWAVPFAIATIGLAEMTLEVVILFAFQVLHGTIYAEVSLIVDPAAFSDDPDLAQLEPVLIDHVRPGTSGVEVRLRRVG